VTQAVPLGLIINEALTNAFKYAFPGGQRGSIRLAFHRTAPATYQLCIEDSGLGLPPGYDPSRSHSLGMTLMYGFSEQIGGQLTVTNRNGLSIKLVFAEEQISPLYTSSEPVMLRS
jgi:two-component sensor histidine kinase